MALIFADPARLWVLSARLWRAGKRRRARLIKLYNFVVFRAILPPEADLRGDVYLGHFGMNIVVHPNVTLGKRVLLWHNSTLSVGDTPGAETRLEIGDNVMIGAGAVIITPKKTSMRICNDVSIGANSVVSRSIEEPGTYAGVPARLLSSSLQESC